MKKGQEKPISNDGRYPEKPSDSKALPELHKDREDCCGCSACYSICPVKAITMDPDEEGFLYPTVHTEKCIRCYLCLSVCVFKTDKESRRTFWEGNK